MKDYTEIWELRTWSNERVIHKIYYKDYPIYEDLPLYTQSEETKKEWHFFWNHRD